MGKTFVTSRHRDLDSAVLHANDVNRHPPRTVRGGFRFCIKTYSYIAASQDLDLGAIKYASGFNLDPYICLKNAAPWQRQRLSLWQLQKRTNGDKVNEGACTGYVSSVIVGLGATVGFSTTVSWIYSLMSH